MHVDSLLIIWKIRPLHDRVKGMLQKRLISKDLWRTSEFATVANDFNAAEGTVTFKQSETAKQCSKKIVMDICRQAYT